MISLASRRSAERFRIRAWIAAAPFAARLIRPSPADPVDLAVRGSEPAKAREFKAAGLQLGINLDCQVVLPEGSARIEPEKEFLDLVDRAGEYRRYALATVTPLDGADCYRLGLRSTNATPSTGTPTLPAFPL